MRGKLRRRTVATSLIAISALLVFAYGETPSGQRFLLGPAPASSGNPSADAFAADDRAVGAGLAPIVYALFPGLIASAFGVAFVVTDLRQKK